ncbi:MAG: GTPase Era [Bacteroidetes bacterium]|nr:GTPase Era [Bacteroidota bacterium]
MDHKAGFVNIVGNANVGKSTLMNLMVGEKLSIVSNKAQTTRQRIHGIVNGDDYQIVFSDTPGILKPAYKLQESMMRFVRTAIEDADLLLYVTDVMEDKAKNETYIQQINQLPITKLVLINKIDLLQDENEIHKHVQSMQQLFPETNILPISALTGYNTDQIAETIKKLLPESPPYFDKEALTDKPERFFVSEIVREKILNLYKQEIPYAVEVGIDSFKEGDDIDRIRAIIYVMRESQKGIIIGNKGTSIKQLGIEARKEMEAFLGKKVYLELFVKIKKDWRNNDQLLKSFGYQ